MALISRMAAHNACRLRYHGIDHVGQYAASVIPQEVSHPGARPLCSLQNPLFTAW